MVRIRPGTVEDAALLWKAEVETAGTAGRLVSRPHELRLEAASLAGLRKVELLVRDSNPGAIRLYQRLGFVEEGRFRDRIRLPDGTFGDDIAMAWFPPTRSG
jgi:GNAT superfamily N-acetyltransferase